MIRRFSEKMNLKSESSQPMATDYPPEIPVDAAQELIRIVRAGTLTSEQSVGLKVAWLVQGYLQRVIESEGGSDVFGILSSDSPVSDELALTELTVAMIPPSTGDIHASPIPAKMLLKWLYKRVYPELMS